MMSDKEPVKIQKVYNPFDSQCNDASTFELQSEGMNSLCLFIFFFLNKLRNLLFDWRHYGDKSKKKNDSLLRIIHLLHTKSFQEAGMSYLRHARVTVLIEDKKC